MPDAPYINWFEDPTGSLERLHEYVADVLDEHMTGQHDGLLIKPTKDCELCELLQLQEERELRREYTRGRN